MDKKEEGIIIDWIKNSSKEKFEIELASSDASFRTYYRINFKSGSKIVMYAPPDKEPLTDFINITKKLKDEKISVPEIFDINEEKGLMLISDFGTERYLDKLNDETVYCLYTDAIDVIHIMQERVSTDNMKYFDLHKQHDELNLFIEWYLRKHLKISEDTIRDYKFYECCDMLLNQIQKIPTSFIHRDYHSRNLMHMNNGNPGVLDYQDAQIGPITYDLVSLLKDCYISWDQKIIDSMIKTFYQRNSTNNVSLDEFEYWFDITGLQRHLKAIGIFSRLFYRDGKENYLNDIPRTQKYVNEVLNKYTELKDMKETFHKLGLDN
tara:strand:- start:3163 stop:4128 length:966 start_codon:yes stop_codon:yes gene_type:complete